MALVDLESSPDRQHTLTPLRNKRVNAYFAHFPSVRFMNV